MGTGIKRATKSVETGGKNAGQEQIGLAGIIADAKLASPSIKVLRFRMTRSSQAR
jgi:hypothetical protein